MLTQFTNAYARMHILELTSYAHSDGSWLEVDAAEMSRFLAILLYFGLVVVKDVEKYWSVTSLLHGL